MISEDEQERLIDQMIDAMAELGEAEQKLVSARKRVEAISNVLFAKWKSRFASQRRKERIADANTYVCRTQRGHIPVRRSDRVQQHGGIA